MEDGEKHTNLERATSRQPFASIFNAGSFLQSLWIRCRTIFPNITDREFMESELRFVLYSGVIFWVIYLFYEAIK